MTNRSPANANATQEHEEARRELEEVAFDEGDDGGVDSNDDFDDDDDDDDA